MHDHDTYSLVRLPLLQHPTLGEVSCTLQTSEDLRLTGFPARK